MEGRGLREASAAFQGVTCSSSRTKKVAKMGTDKEMTIE